LAKRVKRTAPRNAAFLTTSQPSSCPTNTFWKKKKKEKKEKGKRDIPRFAPVDGGAMPVLGTQLIQVALEEKEGERGVREREARGL